MNMIRTSIDTWSAEENLIIDGVVNGTLTIGDLFEMLPGRTLKQIRRKLVWWGNPDEDERTRRAAWLGSSALQRACAESGGRFR